MIIIPFDVSLGKIGFHWPLFLREELLNEVTSPEMSTKSGIRSLVCDPNGIIVAEMVYRCMICSAIHDVLDDAQRHYKTEHIDDNDIDLKNSNQQMVPLDSDLEEEEELNMNYDMSDMFEDVGQNASNTVNVSVPGNLRQLQYQSNANSDSLIMNSPSMDSYNEARAKPITFAQPSNSFLLPFTGNTNSTGSICCPLIKT